MKKLLVLLVAGLFLAGCGSQVQTVQSNLDFVKQKVEDVKKIVVTMESVYVAQGDQKSAEQLLIWEGRLDTLRGFLDTALPQNQCDVVKAGFDLTLKEMAASKESPVNVMMVGVLQSIVESYVCGSAPVK